MRNPHHDLYSQRKSHFYIRNAAEHEPKLIRHIERRLTRWNGFYGFMFREDTHQLLPFGHGLDDGFTAQIHPHDSRVHELVRESLITPYGTPNTLEDGVRHCVEALSQELIQGNTVFEIDYLSPQSKVHSSPTAFRIGWIPSGTVEKVRGQYVQYVPRELGDGRTIHHLHYVDLDPQQLIFVRLNRRLRKVLRRAHAIMMAADRQQGTPYRMLTQSETSFDRDHFHSQLAREFLCGTSNLGWTGRGVFSENMLDPYTVWRHLQFERFKMTIRDAAVAGLNHMLHRAGQAMDFQAQLHLAGLATPHDVEQAQADLQSGARPLIELLRIRA